MLFNKLSYLLLALSVITFNAFSMDEDLTPDQYLLNSVEDESIDQVRKALASGANINAQDGSGYTALSLAVIYGLQDIVTELINRGANVNIKTKFDDTPLMLAIDNGQSEIAKQLIANGADVNASDSEGQTPLHRAAYANDAEIVSLLIIKGADLNVMDENGAAPFDTAVFTDSFRVLPILVVGGANVSRWEGKPIISDYISRGRKIRQRLISNAVIDAVKSGDVEKLLSYAHLADEATMQDEFGNSPMHWAIRNKDRAIIYILLTRFSGESMLEISNEDGNTPMNLLANSPELLEWFMSIVWDPEVLQPKVLTER